MRASRDEEARYALDVDGDNAVKEGANGAAVPVASASSERHSKTDTEVRLPVLEAKYLLHVRALLYLTPDRALCRKFRKLREEKKSEIHELSDKEAICSTCPTVSPPSKNLHDMLHSFIVSCPFLGIVQRPGHNYTVTVLHKARNFMRKLAHIFKALLQYKYHRHK